MTVGELLARVTSAELTEWLAFAEVEPFGEERADLRAGIVASTVAAGYVGKGKRAPGPQDFMPKFGRREKAGGRPSPEELRAKWEKVVAAAFGKK